MRQIILATNTNSEDVARISTASIHVVHRGWVDDGLGPGDRERNGEHQHRRRRNLTLTDTETRSTLGLLLRLMA